MGRSRTRYAFLILLLVAAATGSRGNTGPGNCPECRAMLQRLPQGSIDPQVHQFACATCHHPHDVVKNADGWRATCSTAGCHPRAWNESRFHRLDPKVFETCTNCHRPHLWKADGPDCASCHGAQSGVPLATAAMAAFPHATHARYACARCHDSSVKHAALAITPPGDCLACHHGPPAVAACATCHPSDRTGRILKQEVAMTLAQKAPPIKRTLAFDHGRHEALGCETCHTAPYERVPKLDCTMCHASHHRAEANCTACHLTPLATAHPLTLHETGCASAACHATDSATRLLAGRRLCLTCHTTQTDHQPGRDCAACHLTNLDHGSGKGAP